MCRVKVWVYNPFKLTSNKTVENKNKKTSRWSTNIWLYPKNPNRVALISLLPPLRLFLLECQIVAV